MAVGGYLVGNFRLTLLLSDLLGLVCFIKPGQEMQPSQPLEHTAIDWGMHSVLLLDEYVKYGTGSPGSRLFGHPCLPTLSRNTYIHCILSLYCRITVIVLVMSNRSYCGDSISK